MGRGMSTSTADTNPDEVEEEISFYKLFVPWMRWCAFFFSAVLLTVLGVTKLLYREPDSAITAMIMSHQKPLEVGAEERARERLRNSHAELVERIYLVFGPADRDLVMRPFVTKSVGWCVGEEQVLWDLIRGAQDTGYELAIALRLMADAVCRLMHVRKWYPHGEPGFLVNRMLSHADLLRHVLPADLLLVVDLMGRCFVRICNAVVFYEVRSVGLTSDMLLVRMLRLVLK